MGKLGGVVDTDDNLVVSDAAPATPISPTAHTSSTVAGGPALLVGTEKASFGDFYASHYSDLVRVATLLSGSADSAPDLVQDCFVRLHRHWSAVHDPLPYVRRSVVHACASHHRSIVRRRRLATPVARDSELGADELEDALAKLPARQRAAVVLRYYGDLPDADIARALRCQPGTVRSLIHRALADLREVIKP
jgi:RNA polymerase sigma-70 factor (sigma-E family)